MNATRAISSIRKRLSRATREAGIISSLRGSGWPVLWQVVRDRVWSDEIAIGVRLDLTAPLAGPAAKVPFHIRPLVASDLDRLFSAQTGEVSTDELRDRASRRNLWNTGIPTGYVAITAEEEPCYIQWLMTAKDNTAIQSHFRRRFPELGPDEALLEGAYTAPKYRGKGIMASAQVKLAERASELGASSLLTFIPRNKVGSLKASQRCGFAPYFERRARWRFFHHTVDFTPLPPDTPYPHDISSAAGDTHR